MANARVFHRYDSKANWENLNPLLGKGETGYVDDTEEYKVGDGVRRWKQLPYRGLQCLDDLGDSKIFPVNQDLFTKEIKKLVQKRMLLNVSLEKSNYAFAGKATARLAVSKEYRGVAQVLIYQTIERVVIEYCITADIDNDDVWKADSSWKAVGSGGALNISEDKNNYAFATSGEARAAVQTSDRKQGQIITYCMAGEGWRYEQFTGTDVTKWADGSLWDYYTTDKHLKVLSDYLTESLTNFDTRITETLSDIRTEVSDTITNLNKTVNDKIAVMEEFLSGELIAINESLSSMEKNLLAKIATKADGGRLDNQNRLQLTSGGKDLGTPIDLPNGIVNLSKKDNTEFASPADARSEVKAADRFLGQIITYKLKDGTWVLDQFIGESTGSWASEGSWVQFALSRDLTPVLDEITNLTSRVDAIANDMSSKGDGLDTEDIDESSYAIQLTSQGEVVSQIIVPKGSGGGGTTGITMKLKAVGATNLVVGAGEPAVISYEWTSIDTENGQSTGNGTVYITVNGIPVYTGEVPQGLNKYDLKAALNLGSNNVKVRVTDGYNNARTITFNIQKAELTLSSTFADDLIYKNLPVAFRYTVIGLGSKKIRFWLNGTEIASDTTDASGKQLTKNLDTLNPGSNSIKVVAESNVNGSMLTSNELFYEFIYVTDTIKTPVITASFPSSAVKQFQIINIPYLVYDPDALEADIELVVDDVVKQRLKVSRARQNWSYAAYTQGKFKFEIKCRGVVKKIEITVEASEYNIAEETGDLRYKASAIGKSNQGEDRSQWSYNNIDAVFKNMQWAEDGWQKDTAGNNVLKLIGDNQVEIGITPFNNNVPLNGMTLTIEYATENVTNPKALVASSMLDGIGLEITPSSVRLHSAQSELAVDLDSSTKTSISFVVQKKTETRLMLLFVDGIMSGSLQYPASDNFAQKNARPLTLTAGERSCTALFYTVRWYENNLNFEQIFGNYIYDIESYTEKMAKYDQNNIVDAYGGIDYNKALEQIPCLTIVGELPTYKGDKKQIDLIYEDRNSPLLSFVSAGSKTVQIDVQGTSSQYYPRKNFKFKFGSAGIVMSDSGQTDTLYSMLGTQKPAKIFTMKADFAESSGTHNTGMAVLLQDCLNDLKYTVPPQSQDNRVRTTVFGYPILIFHKETATSNAEFVGKYNFNDDKASEQVFGFTDGCECWEFLNNTSDRCLFKSSDFSGSAWLDDFEGRFPDGHTDPANLQKLFAWIVSCKNNPAKFKSECPQHFNVNMLVYYCLMTEVFGMVDQRAKNMMLTTYGEKGSSGELIWYFIFYDNDTVLGINNEGLIAFDYNIETADPFQDGHVWNGWNSELWTLVESAYRDELSTLYRTMRQQGILSSDSVLRITEDRQSSKWCEAVYNRDGQYKYINPLLDEGIGTFLYALQGSRSRHRMRWVKERFRYQDSKRRAADYMNDYATMRLYTPKTWAGVEPNPNFELTATKAGYCHVKYGSQITASQRMTAGQKYTFAPLTASQFNDTETIVYGISTVKSMGNLAPKYPGTVDISKASALEELLVGSMVVGYQNLNLSVLHTGSNEMLRVVNVANCPSLKQSLALSKCYSLETVEARGSGITGLELPRSGVLKTLRLPASLTSLYLRNQPLLAELIIEGYANLNTVVVDNTPSVNGYNVVKSCLAITGNKLGKVRLTGIDATDDTSAALNALLNMNGEDDNGVPTDVAFVTGKIHIRTISRTVLDNVGTKMPHLKVTYDYVVNIIEFEDSKVKALAIAKWDADGDKELSEQEVQYSTIPSGFLTNSSAVKFNEARYWGGAGSVINNCDTLEEITVVPGKITTKDLPALKKLGIYSTEATSSAPLFKYSTVGNNYSIQQFLLSGRYSENSRKGCILAKQVETTDYYRMILPLRGYSTITIDEKVLIEATDFDEVAYPWGSQLTKLVLNNIYKVNLPSFSSLETVTVNGFSESPDNNFTIPVATPDLDLLVIDDLKGNTINQLQILNTVRTVRLNRIRAGGNDSVFKLSHTKRSVMEIDLPATYMPSVIVLGNNGSSGGSPFQNNAQIVVRSTSLIPLSIIARDNNDLNNPIAPIGKVFVPDNLVEAYKVSGNWGRLSTRIFPLSTL